MWAFTFLAIDRRNAAYLVAFPIIFATMEQKIRKIAVGFVLEPKLPFSFPPEFEWRLPSSS